MVGVNCFSKMMMAAGAESPAAVATQSGKTDVILRKMERNASEEADDDEEQVDNNQQQQQPKQENSPDQPASQVSQ